jgi:MFS family permease
LANRLPFYYGWVIVVVAALAMLATLPGRTQGLGLITEPLLADMGLGRDTYARINFWATILGSLSCLSVGRWVDRYGARLVLVLIVAALGATVVGMSAVAGAASLFVFLTLTRAIGQSALSVVSIALVSKWFHRRISLAMGVYAVLVGLMFAAAFGLVGYAVSEQGWRIAWRGIGLVLLFGFAPLAAWLARSTPESCGLAGDPIDSSNNSQTTGMPLAVALRTPAFWVFALATSLFGLAISGIGLFNEAILRELGFDARTYHMVLAGTALVGLVSQLASGWIGWRWSLRGLMAVALVLYATSLVWLPNVTSLAALWGNAVLMGAAGGMITVVFFAIWPAIFGRAHVGRIQGAAQMLTVLSSAVGPVLFAESATRTGSYAPALYSLAPLVLCLAIATWLMPLPKIESAINIESNRAR